MKAPMLRRLLVVQVVARLMAGTAAAVFWARSDDGTYLKLRWDDAFGFRRTNKNGTTGWCQVIRSGGGDLRRRHVAQDPSVRK